MFCENCGKELAGDIRFCPECGTEIRIPDLSQKIPEKHNQKFESGKTQKTVVPPKKENRKMRVPIWGYNYNLGHFFTFFGAMLEILSLFLPNKTDVLKMDGITMLDFLKIFLKQMLVYKFPDTDEEEIIQVFAYIAIIVYFFCLIIFCLQLETNSLILTSILNMAVVGCVIYQFNEHVANKGNVILDFIQNSRHVTGLGYWLFLISGIIILVSSVLAKMLGSKEKYRILNKEL